MNYLEYITARENLNRELEDLNKEVALYGPVFLVVEKGYTTGGDIILNQPYIVTPKEATCKVNEEHLKGLKVGEWYCYPQQICYVRIK